MEKIIFFDRNNLIREQKIAHIKHIFRNAFFQFSSNFIDISSIYLAQDLFQIYIRVDRKIFETKQIQNNQPNRIPRHIPQHHASLV